MKLRSRYNQGPSMKGLSFKGTKSRTKQSFKDEADINVLMRKYQTSELTGLRKPMFGDFTEMPDYREMQNRITVANEEFLHLDSDVRAMFDNDPANLLEWLSDPENKDEAIELGILPTEQATVDPLPNSEPPQKQQPTKPEKQPETPKPEPSEEPPAQ